MRFWLKFVVLLILIFALAGLLVVTAVNSRHRGKLLQCKMNLFYLGRMVSLFYRNENRVEGKGRVFWHNLREMVEVGKVRHPDPYTCPVLGTTPTDYKNPECIDYRGPSKTLERNEKGEWSYKRGDPIGCDRKGNHGDDSYGFVLFLDLSMEDTTVDVLPDDNPSKRDLIETMTSE